MPTAFAIILDSSALMMPFDRGVDLEKAAQQWYPTAEFFVPVPVANELAYLAAQGKGSAKRHAKAALAYMVRFEEYAIGGKGDDAVVQAARHLESEGYHVVIATGDKGLRARARKKSWPVITVQGHRPLLDGAAGSL